MHTRKIPSHYSKKSRPMWPVMMNDSAISIQFMHQHSERRKLVKTFRNMLPCKQAVVAEVCGETYSKKKCDEME